jgi:hypothetical protein
MKSVQVRDTDVKENDVRLTFLCLAHCFESDRRSRDYIELRTRGEEVTEVVAYQLMIINQQYLYCRHHCPLAMQYS